MNKRIFLVSAISALAASVPGLAVAQNSRPVLRLSDTSVNPYNILYMEKKLSFEAIFYDALKREIIASVETAKKTGKIDPLIKDASFTSIPTDLSYKRILEAAELGLTQVSVVPLDSFYDVLDHRGLGYLEYPFLFSDINHVYKRFFTVTQLTLKDLNLSNKDAVAVGLIPYSFKIFASRQNDVNPFSIQSKVVTFEKNVVSDLYFRQFKGFETINMVNKINPQDPKVSIIETNVIDYYDQKLYQHFPNIFLTNHSLKSWVITVSAQWWRKLSKQEQDVLSIALSKTIGQTTQKTTGLNQAIIAQFKKSPNFYVKDINYALEFKELQGFLQTLYSNSVNNPKLQNYLINRQP